MRSVPVRCLVLASFLCALPLEAVVVRHDKADALYRVDARKFPALVKLPGGQGVLISREWIVTAAHIAAEHPKTAIVNGVSRPIAQVIIHPDYKVADNMQSGDAAALMAFMDSSADIALIKLAAPVTGITPFRLDVGTAVTGMEVAILGRGATGNGLVGEYPNSPHDGELRLAYSRIISSDGRWLRLRFDVPGQALTLEGMPGTGDSGGPIMILVNGKWVVAGLVSHKFASGELRDFQCCHYGQISYQSRMAYYLPWIRQTTGLPLTD